MVEGVVVWGREVVGEGPVVWRFEVSNSELGRKTWADSGLEVSPGESLGGAVGKAVAAAGGQA